MRIAFVGCGYVADFYARTLANHPELEMLGVADRDGARAARFAGFHGLKSYAAPADVLGDPKVELVVNLTNPKSHFAVSKAALETGKHVYSEKPLATVLPEAEELVCLAERRGLGLASAPCSLLGETAQTMWKALRANAIGRTRLAYAELEDGPVPLLDYRRWRSESGSPWPYEDEFDVGCTLEHAGYFVTWLAAFFGPAASVTSFGASLVPEKTGPGGSRTPDFTVACIEHRSGVVARLTCGLFAPKDHSLRIVGDEGVLSTRDGWDFGSQVTLHRRTNLGLIAEKRPRAARLLGFGPRKVPFARPPRFRFGGKGAHRVDFARGIAELAGSIAERRPCRLSARFSLHVNEIVLAIQDPASAGRPRTIASNFDPIAPMPWAT